jgi:hypothetical protein
MKWMCGVLAWLAFLVVVGGCSSEVPQAVVITRPTVSHLCHIDEPPLYPGCDCPPAPCTSGATPHMVVSFASNPPTRDDDGDPLIIPQFAAHTLFGLTEPLPFRPNTTQVWDDTLTLSIEVDTNNVGIGSVQLHLALNVADEAGAGSDSAFGHYHTSGSVHKPTGTLSDSNPVTDATSHKATVKYTSSQYSEPVFLTVTSTNVDTVRKHWTVGVPNLVHVSGVHLQIVGEDTPVGVKHPHAHFALPPMNSTLAIAGSAVYGWFGHDLAVNDMGLPWGGKFDLDAQWRHDTIPPGHCAKHCEHRLGRTADVDMPNAKQYNKLKYLWDSASVRNSYFEQNPVHLHLRYLGPPL